MVKNGRVQIVVYDKALNRIGTLDKFKSLSWYRKYYECGNFELKTSPTSRNVKLLAGGNILIRRWYVEKDGISAPKPCIEAGIIEGIQADDITNTLTVSGRFLETLTSRRVIKSTVFFSGNTEQAFFKLAKSVKEMPLMDFAGMKGYGGNVCFQVSHKQLDEQLKKLSKYSNIAVRIVPDTVNKRLLFETYRGIDRSTGQKSVKPVVFSDFYRNLNGTLYMYNEQNYKNVAVVAGEGEGSSRIVREVTVDGEVPGIWELREMAVDVRDLQKDEGMSEAEYQETLQQRGLESLNEQCIASSFEAQSAPLKEFEYMEDYDLGDVVSIQKESWGLFADKRITEVQEIFENGTVSLIPTYGTPLPDTLAMSD